MKSFILDFASDYFRLENRFLGDSQIVRWPQENVPQLRMAGIWNLLFCCGAYPKIIEADKFFPSEEGDVLNVVADTSFSPKTEKTIKEWLLCEGFI